VVRQFDVHCEWLKGIFGEILGSKLRVTEMVLWSDSWIYRACG